MKFIQRTEQNTIADYPTETVARKKSHFGHRRIKSKKFHSLEERKTENNGRFSHHFHYNFQRINTTPLDTTALEYFVNEFKKRYFLRSRGIINLKVTITQWPRRAARKTHKREHKRAAHFTVRAHCARARQTFVFAFQLRGGRDVLLGLFIDTLAHARTHSFARYTFCIGIIICIC